MIFHLFGLTQNNEYMVQSSTKGETYKEIDSTQTNSISKYIIKIDILNLLQSIHIIILKLSRYVKTEYKLEFMEVIIKNFTLALDEKILMF